MTCIWLYSDLLDILPAERSLSTSKKEVTAILKSSCRRKAQLHNDNAAHHKVSGDSTSHHSTAQHSMHIIAQHSTAQHSTAQHAQHAQHTQQIS